VGYEFPLLVEECSFPEFVELGCENGFDVLGINCENGILLRNTDHESCSSNIVKSLLEELHILVFSIRLLVSMNCAEANEVVPAFPCRLGQDHMEESICP